MNRLRHLRYAEPFAFGLFCGVMATALLTAAAMLAALAAAGETVAVIIGARRGGKMTAYRLGVEAAALSRQHVHALARDGQWCVTAQQIGFLWSRVPRGWKPCPACGRLRAASTCNPA